MKKLRISTRYVEQEDCSNHKSSTKAGKLAAGAKVALPDPTFACVGDRDADPEPALELFICERLAARFRAPMPPRDLYQCPVCGCMYTVHYVNGLWEVKHRGMRVVFNAQRHPIGRA